MTDRRAIWAISTASSVARPAHLEPVVPGPKESTAALGPPTLALGLRGGACGPFREGFAPQDGGRVPARPSDVATRTPEA